MLRHVNIPVLSNLYQLLVTQLKAIYDS